MEWINTLCIWVGELTPLIASTSVFLYGAIRFFRKGKALYLQVVTAAIGCYALATLYHLCQMLVMDAVSEGFTPAYLGRIGFYLFLFTANFGQMNGIMDDGSKKMRPSRYIGLLGPAIAIALYLPCALVEMPLPTKLTYAAVWAPACLSLYFNLKHAVIPDLGYNFAKAVRPYNLFAFFLALTDLLHLLSWVYYDTLLGYPLIALSAVVFSVLCVLTVRSLEKGVREWML